VESETETTARDLCIQRRAEGLPQDTSGLSVRRDKPACSWE